LQASTISWLFILLGLFELFELFMAIDLAARQDIQVASLLSDQREVSLRGRLQKRKPSQPVMSPWPNLESFQPPKPKGSRGTGTPTLTPHMPASKPSTRSGGRPRRRGEDRRGVAVGVLVLDGDGFVDGAGADDREHRSEDLLAAGGHVGADVVEHRGADPPALAAVGADAAAVDEDLGAELLGLIDVAVDAVDGGARDDRAHVLAELELAGDLGDGWSMMGWMSPTATMSEAAMQRWPAQP
jgi:hypothetical protein